MRLIVLASTLILAGCATRPQQAPTPIPQQPQPVPVERSGLNGLTPNELVTRLGTPALQIREGTSLKLQFRSPSCVLDAYLYPTAGGQMRVTHVDTRLPAGTSTNQAACIAAIENPI
ncbi:MAG TPA: hypothetical protein VIL42_03045 [Sphingomicrobium sp.]|jgi:hypothetical protein